MAGRVVILTWDQPVSEGFWLSREYLPEIIDDDRTRAVPIDRLVELLGGAEVRPVPIPHDCEDGFLAAFWRRPHRYLDPEVRAGISTLARLGPTRSTTGSLGWRPTSSPASGSAATPICSSWTSSTSATGW